MRKTRNKFEERIRRELVHSNVEHGYESLKLRYTIEGIYTPDFLVCPSHQHCFLIECKGYFRAADKRKLAAVKRCNPLVDIRILFYREDPRSINWAIRNGFTYAIGTIPKEWLS